MSTTRDIPDPAPPGATPAEAELIRRAREWAGTPGPREWPRDLLDALADALGRAARERDARSDEAGAGRELARAVLESWADASLAERCPAESIPATDALRFAALRVLGRPIGERDGGETPGKAPQSPQDAPGTPAAPGIDAGAIERAVDRIEALSQSPRCYDWQVRPEFRADDAEIRRLYDRFGGETGFDEAGRRARMEVFARVLREELGPAPAAGRGGDEGGGRA